MLGVVSSALARTICPECREEYTPQPEALRWLGLEEIADKVKFYHGTGCENCRGNGYRGRIGLHEVLIMDNEMRQMIAAGQIDPNAILRHAIGKGFITMIEVARKRVLEGVTTAEEAFRIAGVITSGPV
jgi:type II secretory ATPase GspE/PulE/Tfp pilus assembly ATPase PilB-like protein